MAIAEVGAGSQRAVGTGTGQASVALAFPGSVANASLLIVGFSCYNGAAAPAAVVVSDTRSTPYTVLSAVGGDGNNYRYGIAYGIAPSGGACTVTVDPTGSCDIGFAIDEFSGVDATPLDVDGGTSFGSNLTPSDSLTTLTANALLIGCCSWDGSHVVTPGGSYTQIGENESTSFQPFSAVFRLVTTATSYAVDWTVDTGTDVWNVYTAAFKPGAAVGESPVSIKNNRGTRPRPFAPGLAR